MSETMELDQHSAGLCRQESEKQTAELPLTSRPDIAPPRTYLSRILTAMRRVDIGRIVGNAHIEIAQAVWNCFGSYIFFIISTSSRTD
jgi:hypothetical protein